MLHWQATNKTKLPSVLPAERLKPMCLSDQIDHCGSSLSSRRNSTNPEVSRGGAFLRAALKARSKSWIDCCVLAARISSFLIRSSSGPAAFQFSTQRLRERSGSLFAVTVPIGHSLRHLTGMNNYVRSKQEPGIAMRTQTVPHIEAFQPPIRIDREYG